MSHSTDAAFMRRALRRAAKGTTSSNPMAGARLVKNGVVLGEGWHQRAGERHAEIEALRAAVRKGRSPRGATLYVTLEPCSTFGRTPPCTAAIIEAGVKHVIVGATDPNPLHSGRGFALLRKAGIKTTTGVLEQEAMRLNQAFNHWILKSTPWVTVKAAMTLDGKIATADGKSKWITGEKARAYGMKLRKNSDAVLVGVNTVLADNPSLTVRDPSGELENPQRLRRIIVDSHARTPLSSQVVADEWAHLTTLVVTPSAPAKARAALAKRAQVLVAPAKDGRVDLSWLLRHLGAQKVASLLVEGGGEVNASLFFEGYAHQIAFFYAPKILGGSRSVKGVGGGGAVGLGDALRLK